MSLLQRTLGIFARGWERPLLESEQGQALIEFALTLPILLLIVTGIFAFGIALNNMLGLTNATSTGARQFALMRGQGGDPCAVSVGAIAAAAPLLQNTGSTTGIGYSILVAGATYNANAPTCSGATLTQGQPVKVTTTYPCSLLLYGVNAFPSCKLTAISAEVIQ